MTAPAEASAATSVGVNIQHAEAPIHIYTGSGTAPRPPLPAEPETVPIAAGPCLLGHPPGDGIPAHETPTHRIALPAFRIGRFPVTNRQYQAFIQVRRHQDAPGDWRARRVPRDRLDHPVTGLSWHDARAYCAWLAEETGRGYRLPTEAEWEQAARAPDGRLYPWGPTWQDGRCNAGADASTEVMTFPDGASPQGAMDLLGNVQEWTLTCWGPDPANSAYPYPYDGVDGRDDPQLPCGYRIHRGGSWRDPPAELRASARGWAAPDSRVHWRGFRVLLPATD